MKSQKQKVFGHKATKYTNDTKATEIHGIISCVSRVRGRPGRFVVFREF